MTISGSLGARVGRAHADRAQWRTDGAHLAQPPPPPHRPARRGAPAPARGRQRPGGAPARRAIRPRRGAAARAAASRTPSPPDPALAVSVARDAGGPPVAARFLGLSFEAQSVPDLARFSTAGDLPLLLRSLGPSVLRIGGVTADSRVAFAAPGERRAELGRHDDLLERPARAGGAGPSGRRPRPAHRRPRPRRPRGRGARGRRGTASARPLAARPSRSATSPTPTDATDCASSRGASPSTRPRSTPTGRRSRPPPRGWPWPARTRPARRSPPGGPARRASSARRC